MSFNINFLLYYSTLKTFIHCTILLKYSLKLYYNFMEYVESILTTPSLNITDTLVTIIICKTCMLCNTILFRIIFLTYFTIISVEKSL